MVKNNSEFPPEKDNKTKVLTSFSDLGNVEIKTSPEPQGLTSEEQERLIKALESESNLSKKEILTEERAKELDFLLGNAGKKATNKDLVDFFVASNSDLEKHRVSEQLVDSNKNTDKPKPKSEYKIHAAQYGKWPKGEKEPDDIYKKTIDKIKDSQNKSEAGQVHKNGKSELKLNTNFDLQHSYVDSDGKKWSSEELKKVVLEYIARRVSLEDLPNIKGLKIGQDDGEKNNGAKEGSDNLNNTTEIDSFDGEIDNKDSDSKPSSIKEEVGLLVDPNNISDKDFEQEVKKRKAREVAGKLAEEEQEERNKKGLEEYEEKKRKLDEKNQASNADQENQEKKGFFRALASAVVGRLTFKKTRDLWGEYREGKSERKEIKEKLKTESETLKSSKELMQAISEDGHLDLNSLNEKTKKDLEKYIGDERASGRSKEEIEKDLKEIAPILKKAHKLKENARYEAVGRLKEKSEEANLKRAEMIIEGLKSASTWGGIILAGGATAGLEAGAVSALSASVGFGRLLSIPSDVALRMVKEKGEDNFFNYAKKTFSEGTREFLGAFKSGKSVKERLAILGKTSGKGVLAGFSAYAMAHGMDRVFETDLTGAINEEVSGTADKIKNWFSHLFDKNEPDLPEVHGIDRDPELVAGLSSILDNSSVSVDNFPQNANIDSSHIDPNAKVEDYISQDGPKIAELEVKVPKGQGAIKTFELLQEKLAEQYANLSTSERPAFVNQILNGNAEEMAKKFGFYNPNSPQESAMLHLGDSFRISENGLEYVHANGDSVLLEENDLTSGQEGNFGDKGGKMFDSNPEDIASVAEFIDNSTDTQFNHPSSIPDASTHDTDVQFPDSAGNDIVPPESVSETNSTLSEILTQENSIDNRKIINHLTGLSNNGSLNNQEINKIFNAFAKNIDKEDLELMNAGRNFNLTLEQGVAILKDGFGVEISEQDISHHFNGRVNLSAESINKIIDIWANKDQELTKEIVLDQIFGRGEKIREVMENNIGTEEVLRDTVKNTDSVQNEVENIGVFKEGTTWNRGEVILKVRSGLIIADDKMANDILLKFKEKGANLETLKMVREKIREIKFPNTKEGLETAWKKAGEILTDRNIQNLERMNEL